MNIVTSIAEPEAIAATFVHCVGWTHGLHREGLAVEQPIVKSAARTVVFDNCHVESFVGRCRYGAGLAENGIIPTVPFRLAPLRLALGVRVFDHNAHAVASIVVGEITHDPHTRMVHLHNRRDTLRGAEPQYGHVRRRWHGIAVERNDPENMAGRGETADFTGTGVDNMKHNPIALFHSDRLAVPEHLAVDAEKIVADLVAFRAFELFVGLPADVLQFFDWGADEKVHRHVAALAERR